MLAACNGDAEIFHVLHWRASYLPCNYNFVVESLNNFLKHYRSTIKVYILKTISEIPSNSEYLSVTEDLKVLRFWSILKMWNVFEELVTVGMKWLTETLIM